MSYISTSRSFLSISTSFLASLYNGTPFTFKAEYIGGTCLIFPKNDLKTSSISSLLCFLTSLLSSTSPSRSKVFVFIPSFKVAKYSLEAFSR